MHMIVHVIIYVVGLQGSYCQRTTEDGRYAHMHTHTHTHTHTMTLPRELPLSSLHDTKLNEFVRLLKFSSAVSCRFD